MTALGLGLGLAFGALNAGGPSNTPDLWPGQNWSGTFASGFPASGAGSITPDDYIDPQWVASDTNLLTADSTLQTADNAVSDKPWCRELFAPGFPLNADTVIAFDAGTQNTSGISYVEFNCEGRTVQVTTPSLHTYTDSNGNSSGKFFYGYAVNLKASSWLALNASGEADLYVKVVPADANVQKRVCGPYRMRMRNVGSEYDFRANIDISLVADTAPTAFKSLQNALNYASANGPTRTNLFTVIKAGGGTVNLDLTANANIYNGADRAWTVVQADTGVTVTLSSTSTGNGGRLRYDGICFRGSSIQIDPISLNFYYQEDTGRGAVCFDGVTVSQVNGSGTTFPATKAIPAQYWVRRPTLPADCNIYFLDCVGTNLFNGFSNAKLVRGCTLTNCSADAMQNNACIHNCTVTTVDPATWRTPSSSTNALTVTYSGASTVALSVDTGLTTASTRILSLMVDSVQFGASLTLNTTPTTFNDVATWLNGLGLAGLSAATTGVGVLGSTGERRALYISHSSLSDPVKGSWGTGIPITAGGTTFCAQIDVHPDFQQQFGQTSPFYPALENRAYRFVTFLYPSDAVVNFIFNDQTSSIIRSQGFRDYLTKAAAGIASRNLICSAHQSVLFENITAHHDTQLDRALSGASNFAPTNVVIRKCAMEFIEFLGTTTSMAPNLTIDTNWVRTATGGTLIAGATNTTAANSAAWTSVVVDDSTNNYTPLAGQALDLGGGNVIGRYNTDGSEHVA